MMINIYVTVGTMIDGSEVYDMFSDKRAAVHDMYAMECTNDYTDVRCYSGSIKDVAKRLNITERSVLDNAIHNPLRYDIG